MAAKQILPVVFKTTLVLNSGFLALGADKGDFTFSLDTAG